MNRLVPLVAIAFVLVVLFIGKEDQTTRLFILSGQSNMVNLNPRISFFPTLKNTFFCDDVVLAKVAVHGQSICRWNEKWTSDTGTNQWATGDLYERLMKEVDSVLKGKRPDTITFVWMQGEADTRGEGRRYGAHLRGVVDQLERDFGRKDITMVIGRLSDFGINHKDRPQWNMVREAQVAFAEENALVGWVDTDDLNGPDDNLHYTWQGYRELGVRLAKKATELIKKSERGDLH